MSELLDKLTARHPWYQEQDTEERWRANRAVLRKLRSINERKVFLHQGEFELKEHYDLRVKMSKFLGVTEQVVSRFLGAVFDEPPTFEMKDAELEAWSKNVDGQGTSLTDWIENQGYEAAVMGAVHCFVDRSRLSAEQEADLAGRGIRPADLTSKAALEPLGLYWPRLISFPVEQLVDWDHDSTGLLLWARLERQITTSGGPLEPRQRAMEWLVIDRLSVKRYVAKIKADQMQITGDLDASGMPRIRPSQDLDEPTMTGEWPHGAGRVPVETLYARMLGPTRGEEIVGGTIAADLAGFHEESHATFARYLHNIPLLLLKLKANRSVDEVVKDAGGAWKLDADSNEDAEYVTTPSESFEASEKVIERLALTGFRAGNADPSGLFDGGSMPESGKKAGMRMRATEGRELRRFAKSLRRFALGVLELAARRLSPTIVPAAAAAFKGDVRYPDTFELEGADAVIDRYLEVGPNIESPKYHRLSLERIVNLTLTDISPADAQEISRDIEKQQFRFDRERLPEADADLIR